MQAIVTKYHGPTEHRGPRISATSGSGHQRVYVDIPDNLVAWGEGAHRLAAVALCKKLDWPAAQLVGGGLRNGYVFVFAPALPADFLDNGGQLWRSASLFTSEAQARGFFGPRFVQWPGVIDNTAGEAEELGVRS